MKNLKSLIMLVFATLAFTIEAQDTKDYAIKSITAPVSGNNLNLEQVKVEIQNNGTATTDTLTSTYIHLFVNGVAIKPASGTGFWYNFSHSGNRKIGPNGDFFEWTVQNNPNPITIDLSKFGTYEIMAIIADYYGTGPAISGDANRSNDTARITVVNSPVAGFKDAAALEILSPTVGFGLTNSETVSIKFRNRSADAQNVPVTLTVNGEIAKTLTISNFNGEDTDTVIDFTGIDLAAYKEYVINAFTSLSGDENPANDTATKVINHTENNPDMPFLEDFENESDGFPIGWISSPADAWEVGDEGSGTLSTQHAFFSFYNWHSDGWLYSKEILFEEGKSYRLSFDLKTTAAPRNQELYTRLKVFLGTDKNAMTDTLFTTEHAYNDAERVSASFVVPSTGRYYVGFYAYQNEEILGIDNISINEFVALGMETAPTAFPAYTQMPVNMALPALQTKVESTGENPLTQVKFEAFLNETSIGSVIVDTLRADTIMVINPTAKLKAGENTLVYKVSCFEINTTGETVATHTVKGTAVTLAIDGLNYADELGEGTGIASEEEGSVFMGNLFTVHTGDTLRAIELGFATDETLDFDVVMYLPKAMSNGRYQYDATTPLFSVSAVKTKAGFMTVDLGDAKFKLEADQPYLLGVSHSNQFVTHGLVTDGDVTKTNYLGEYSLALPYQVSVEQYAEFVKPGAMAIRMKFANELELDDPDHPSDIQPIVIANENVKIYPNPVTHVLNIQTNEKVQNIEVYSIDGKLLKSIQGQNQIAVDDLKAGVYMLKTTTGKGLATQRFVKQ